MYLSYDEKSFWVRRYRCDVCNTEAETSPEPYQRNEGPPPPPDGWKGSRNGSIHYCKPCWRERERKFAKGYQERITRDRQRFEEMTNPRCMLCGVDHDQTSNCRLLNCFRPIHESVPEAIDMRAVSDYHRSDESYYLRLCPDCSESLQQHLKNWREERHG